MLKNWAKLSQEIYCLIELLPNAAEKGVSEQLNINNSLMKRPIQAANFQRLLFARVFLALPFPLILPLSHSLSHFALTASVPLGNCCRIQVSDLLEMHSDNLYTGN